MWRQLYARKGARDTLILLQFLHRAISLVDGTVGVRVGIGVGVRNRQASEGFARHLARRFAAFQPELVEQRIVFIRVAVGPAVHRDFEDVASRIESSRPKNSQQLLADVALIGFEGGGVELHTPEGMLLARGVSGL